jgi:hypothetical protein
LTLLDPSPEQQLFKGSNNSNVSIPNGKRMMLWLPGMKMKQPRVLPIWHQEVHVDYLLQCDKSAVPRHKDQEDVEEEEEEESNSLTARWHGSMDKEDVEEEDDFVDFLDVATHGIQYYYWRWYNNNNERNNVAIIIQQYFQGYWVRDCIAIDQYCAAVIQAMGRGFIDGRNGHINTTNTFVTTTTTRACATTACSTTINNEKESISRPFAGTTRRAGGVAVIAVIENEWASTAHVICINYTTNKNRNDAIHNNNNNNNSKAGTWHVEWMSSTSAWGAALPSIQHLYHHHHQALKGWKSTTKQQLVHPVPYMFWVLVALWPTSLKGGQHVAQFKIKQGPNKQATELFNNRGCSDGHIGTLNAIGGNLAASKTTAISTTTSWLCQQEEDCSTSVSFLGCFLQQWYA